MHRGAAARSPFTATNLTSWRSGREAASHAASDAVVGSWSEQEGRDPNLNLAKPQAHAPGRGVAPRREQIAGRSHAKGRQARNQRYRAAGTNEAN
jgi:hypothetical protein